jgi:hypothetical protein
MLGLDQYRTAILPLSAELGDILRKLMQTGGTLQQLTVDDLLRALIPFTRESLEEEREAQLERQITLILQRRD